jgi:hypothetical protein
VTAVNGVATFEDLQIQGSSSNTYSLRFTATFSTNPKELISNVKLELIERLNKCGISL